MTGDAEEAPSWILLSSAGKKVEVIDSGKRQAWGAGAGQSGGGGADGG